MCGIVALFAPNELLPKDGLKSRLDAALERIEHRGPDARGRWVSESSRCALAHCRLAINDLTPDGEQPLHTPDHTIHAVVNGEIYSHHTLRSSLESTGYVFKGHGDSELAIALYQTHGLSFLSHLRGEFALVLYDERSELFIAARDRYGIKPLFWRMADGGRLEIAAEIKAFLGLAWEAEWDVGAMVDGGWGQDTRTLFKGVNKLRPGCYMTCRVGGIPEIRQYWDIDYPDKRAVDPRSDTEMISSVRTHLIEAVRLRLRADVPVGIYLSGGIDSSALAGIATHLVREGSATMGSQTAADQICCFSIGFDEASGFDESEIAQRTAEWLGVKFVKAHMSESELASRFEDAVYHCEHHNPDLNFVGKYALSEVPRQYGYKVVLTGEGSDEQFAGYPQFLPDYLSGLDLPDEERRGLVRESEEAIKTLYEDMGATSRFFEEENKLNLSIPASMLAFAPPQTIFAPWARKQFGKIDPVDTVSNNLDGVARDRIRDRWHPLNSAMYTWSKGNLVNQFLSCLGDRVEMAHSIEARTPFLDHHLTTYVNSLPPDLKLHPDPTNKGKYIEKYALREAMKEFVTPEIYARRKHAYSAPTKFDTGGPIRSMLERMVTREGVEALGFMDWEEVEGLMGRAFGGEGEARAWRVVLIVAEWVVLGKRFGVKKAGGTEDEGKRGV